MSGGVALGAYHGGVYEALAGGPLDVGWIAGSSVGAVNAALIAGTPAERRLDTLRKYWLSPRWGGFEPPLRQGPFRNAFNWFSAAQARLAGSSRHFHPGGMRSLYSLAPTAAFLREHVDFGRLNGGDIRVTVAAVDLESGDPTYFDTGKGCRLEVDHLLASCGYLPEFAPVEIEGRLLGDGGLAVNAPVEPVLDEWADQAATVVVADLFARDGDRPAGLEAALERKNSLMFANQTWGRLDLWRRTRLRLGAAQHPTILYLSYRPLAEEAGPEAPFDFSRASALDRWREGRLDGEHAIDSLDTAAGERAILTAIRRKVA